MDSSVLQILPLPFREHLLRINTENVEEIRLRIGGHVNVVKNGHEYSSGGPTVTGDVLQYILSAASGASIYAVNDSMKQGFLTLPGGHRIGICGNAIMENGSIRTLCHYSSISIRIASARSHVGIGLTESTLIVGPPGSGKTTLLRDCIRILSDDLQQRVCLVDERGEVAAITLGKPQYPVGERTDVMCGCPKAMGIEMVLRSMNPQWIAVDEITREEDADAVLQAGYCGVNILATAHAASNADILSRPIYRQLVSGGIFRQALIMKEDHTYCKKGLI